MPPIIHDSFTNNQGVYFSKVRELIFQKEDLVYSLGKYITETNRESDYFLKDSYFSTGVYIYQSHIDKSIGYRIYKEFADPGFRGYDDDKLIQKLQEKQNVIKLTDFPTGVITLNKTIIGQQIPYYFDYVTLYYYFKNYKVLNPLNIYI